ncbi:Glucose dehydrogenase [FAD, quinone] [Armadillidium vulgare]|nr:Glucose dehydrogenase [FAD, quinone] [Armadillidium vulgare]
MADQLSIIPAILISSFFLSVYPPNAAYNPPTTDDVRTQYDFIVVGSGSAGSVVANRLSENPDFKVLLLEAGGKATETTEIPLFASLAFRSKLDWNYTLAPSSQYCLGMIDNTCYYVKGKGLGGTSIVNTMLYVRGNKKDFDDWADAGNYGWSFEDVLPYFKKSEDNRNKEFAKNERFHSTGGELTVSDISWKTPLADPFVAAGSELGYPEGDFNAENQAGKSKHTQIFTNLHFIFPYNYKSL